MDFLDNDADYQEDFDFPGEDEDFCADLLDGYADYDDHVYAADQEELSDRNESSEYLLGEDLLEGYEEEYDDDCDAAGQDLNHPTEGDEHLLCDDLLAGWVEQDLDNPDEGDEHLLCDDSGGYVDDELFYTGQDLDNPNESDEYVTCGDSLVGYADQDQDYSYEGDDFDEFEDYDDYWYPTHDEDEQELGGFANYSYEYWHEAQGQQNLNESEEAVCEQLMERLQVADRYTSQMHARTRTVTKQVALKMRAVKIEPPASARLSPTTDGEASGSQTETGSASLPAAVESVRTASVEIMENVAENSSALVAERLSIKNCDVTDTERSILQPD